MHYVAVVGLAMSVGAIASPTLKPTEDDLSQVCFAFSPEGIDGFYYANAGGVWGSASGYVSGDQYVCVPTSNVKGGGMYVGPEANPGPGSTKIECKFPTSGTANCDISLVDGYSLFVNCQVDNTPTIGGYSLAGGQCPDQRGDDCINTEGYSASQSDVAAFFQAGVENGNNYCIWHNCKQDYYFPVSNTISCIVGL